MTEQTAPFYNELHRVLKAVNGRHPNGEQVSYRRAVVEGLGLRDSFTSKIKDGTYRPTLDRLISLSALLNVPPTTFDAYVKRWGHEQVDNDPAMLMLLRELARQEPRTQILLMQGIRNHIATLLEQAGPQKQVA
jgi:hypothetical protein